MSEQAELIGSKHPNFKVKRVLSVYVGTPNRLSKLYSQYNAYDLTSDRFRYMVIDCRPNQKSYSIFEQNETRDDLLDLIQMTQESFNKEERKDLLKISLV